MLKNWTIWVGGRISSDYQRIPLTFPWVTYVYLILATIASPRHSYVRGALGVSYNIDLQYLQDFVAQTCTRLQVFCAPSNWMPVQYWYNVGLQYSQIRRYMKYSSLNMSLDEFCSKYVNMSSLANLPVWQVNYIGWSSYIMSTLLLSLIWNRLD